MTGQTDLRELALRFRNQRVLVIGDAMLDSYLEGRVQRICSEGPVPVVDKTAEEHLPGGAANIAANLAALGATVEFCAIVGDDTAATRLRCSLQKSSVSTSRLVSDLTASTIHKMRIVAEEQYVVRFDQGGLLWSPSSTAALLRHIAEAVRACDGIVISDYGYSTACDRVLHLIKRLRHDRPVPLFVDSKHLRRFRSMAASFVTPNHLEAFLTVERTFPLEEDFESGRIESLGRRLLTLIDAEGVAITLGRRGAFLLRRDQAGCWIPNRPCEPAHDVGAGDSFLAGFALGCMSGAADRDAATIGVEVGGIAVAKRRTAVVSHQELILRLAMNSAPVPTSGTPEDVCLKIDRERQRGRKVVFTNGVFDILHAGHVDLLRRAAELGDLLVVAVNSDASARRLKGRNRPINSERDRLALVAAMDPVDYVLLLEDDDPSHLIRRLRPHLHVKGEDYRGEPLPEMSAVAEVGGSVEFIPLARDLSTTRVIDRIVGSRALENLVPESVSA